MAWSEYWIWFSAALILGILEIVLPGYILLGFALGAAVIGVLFLAGGVFAEYLAGSLPITLIFFAAVSLAVWLLMRRIFGNPKGSVKVWDTDINEH